MGRVLPILFNTEMVRAILDDRKTVTRRIVKQSVWEDFVCERGKVVNFFDKKTDALESPTYKAPFQIGDVLYVRETWSEHYTANSDGKLVYCYKSDGINLKAECLPGETNRWYPSIHMPKQAARIWLKVTNVRVERLQEITIDGCEEEGCWSGHNGDIFAFMSLWDSTIKKQGLDRYGWNANPWVWVVEFERCGKPDPCIVKGIEPASDNSPCIGYQKSKEDDEPCEMCKGCKWCDGEEPESEV